MCAFMEYSEEAGEKFLKKFSIFECPLGQTGRMGARAQNRWVIAANPDEALPTLAATELNPIRKLARHEPESRDGCHPG